MKCTNENKCIVCNDGYKLNDNELCDLININDEEYNDVREYLEIYAEVKQELIQFFENLNSENNDNNDNDNGNKDNNNENNNAQEISDSVLLYIYAQWRCVRFLLRPYRNDYFGVYVPLLA